MKLRIERTSFSDVSPKTGVGTALLCFQECERHSAPGNERLQVGSPSPEEKGVDKREPV